MDPFEKYIDQPVGTGFSFTKNDLGYATNQDMVADGLYEAMRQFYLLFPDLLKSDLYITGESYAGNNILREAIVFFIHELVFFLSN